METPAKRLRTVGEDGEASVGLLQVATFSTLLVQMASSELLDLVVMRLANWVSVRDPERYWSKALLEMRPLSRES